MQDLYSVGVGETAASGSLVESFLTKLEGWAGRNADGVAVIHERLAVRVRDTLGVPAERISVIRNWSHVDHIDDFDREAFRHDLGWTDRRVVLHAGAMGEKQSLANVVEAARLAESRGSDVFFALIGDGGQRRRLETQAAGLNQIVFLDPLSHVDFGRAMRAADLLLVNEKPGVVEMAVPSKLTSYFSSGRPVLAATDESSTTAEEVAASGAGWRVDPGNPTAMFAAIETVLSDSQVADAVGARGPAYCANVLSQAKAIDAYEAWLHDLVSRRTDGEDRDD